MLQQGLGARDLTQPIRCPPSLRLKAHALRGWWPRFPMDPKPYEDRIADRVTARLRSGWGGVRMTREVDRIVETERRALEGKVAAQLALLRAAVTAGEAAFDAGLRDSEGEFSSWCGRTLVAYAALPRHDARMDAEVYLQDLCGLWVCEQYASTYELQRVW